MTFEFRELDDAQMKKIIDYGQRVIALIALKEGESFDNKTFAIEKEIWWLRNEVANIRKAEIVEK